MLLRATRLNAIANTNILSSIEEPPYISPAGQPVIDLGVGNGQLINGVQIEGKWYYHWDIDGTGFFNPGDRIAHTVLDGIFKYDINGVLETAGNQVGLVGKTDNTYRYATINGVKVALPTYGSTMSGDNASPINVNKSGTSASLNPTADNPTYDGLLAIWDNYNGTGTGTGMSGAPPGWALNNYWSATPSASGHASVNLNIGYVNDLSDTITGFVALHVL